ncbi:MAG: hypothetical protein KF852_02960 [Saprospiraceae bacterium]|nr:hypothetical protein [Saprospiraceae bacterium]
MKNNKPANLKLLWWVLPLAFVLSCYEQREGCLDIGATNFAPDADRPCPDNCCAYPALRMSFQHRLVYGPDSVVNFRLIDSVYYDVAGQPYRVQDFRFFLSNARLVRPDGAEVALSNRIAAQLFQPGGSLQPDSIINDILLVRPALTAQNNIGTLRATGAFTALKFTVGIVPPVASVEPESLPNNHPLRPTASGMAWSEGAGYEFHRAVFLPGLTDTARVTVNVQAPVYTRTIDLPININVPEGFNLEFDIQIDYLRWLSDISPATQPPAALLENLVANTAASFSITQIRFNPR